MNFPPTASFYRYRPSAWLRVAGCDAAAFLQGQFTNDVRRVADGAAVYGLWLDQKGKVLADSFLLRGRDAEEFWIGSYFSPASAIRRRLEDYIVADDVTVEDMTPLWTGVSLIGEGSGGWLAARARAGMTFKGRRSGVENWDWILPLGSAEEAARELAGSREMGEFEASFLRIHSGIPAVPADIGPRDLPNEGGLEADAISATKGCYLGQEVMARLKSKGRIRRRLHRVSGIGPPPAVPGALWQGGAKVGELRSATADRDAGGFAGLAMLSLANVRLEEPLALGENQSPSIRAAPLISI